MRNSDKFSSDKLNKDRVAVFDRTLRLVSANEPWSRFSSGKPALNSKNLLATFQLPPHLPEMELLNSAISNLFSGSQRYFDSNYLGYEGGSPHIYNFSLSAIGRAESLQISARHRDVTSRFRKSHVLPLISAHTASIQQQERQRIAAELHDSTSQHLAAVNLNIINLKRAITKGERTNQLIDAIEMSAEAAQDEIRLSSYLLFPFQVEAEGLKSTIQHYVAGFARRAHLNATCKIPSWIDATPIALQHGMLWTIQEGLSNVHRHASAHHVKVTISLNDQSVVLKIIDDGRGIPTSDANAIGIDYGVGIRSIEARLHEIHGALHFASSADGTTLTAAVPLTSEEAAALQGWPVEDRPPLTATRVGLVLGSCES